MYPVRLSFTRVIARIQRLQGRHPAEALVTSVFTFEKLMKRCVRRSIVARGFTVVQAEQLLDRKGFDEVARMWEVFEHEHRTLPEILSNQVWQRLSKAKGMRNALVHGNKTFDLDECDEQAERVLDALDRLHDYGLAEFEDDPWQNRPRKKASLRWAP